jgi:flagellar motor switch protein FliM
MVAEFATARATLRQLISLKRGDFISLDMPETVTAKVEGVSIFDCNYGVSSGRYAIKVRETLSGIEEVLKGNSHE